MTNQFVDANKMVPITPPPELVELWYRASEHANEKALQDVATQAARWGADQELEACITWVAIESLEAAKELRTARRPKPPSLKAQAIAALTEEQAEMSMVNYKTIRTALDSLPS